LLLQVGVEAFEDAGYSKETLQRKYQGDVGVLVGTMNNSYNLYGFQNMLQRGAQADGARAEDEHAVGGDRTHPSAPTRPVTMGSSVDRDVSSRSHRIHRGLASFRGVVPCRIAQAWGL